MTKLQGKPCSLNSSECATIASVLIVDDSIVQRSHAVSLCRQLGVHTIHTAGNGSEAITLLAGLIAPPSLLILDLEMPTLDGAQTLEVLKQQPTFRASQTAFPGNFRGRFKRGLRVVRRSSGTVFAATATGAIPCAGFR